jgi:type IV secretory pathway VirB2 component (pilin)
MFLKAFFFLNFLFLQNFVLANDATISGIGTVKYCLDGDNKIDQSLCENSTLCIMLPSSLEKNEPTAYCTRQGVEYCKTDSDCNVLGRSKCNTSFSTPVAYSEADDTLGVCSSSSGTTEDNVLGDFLCKIIKTVTGKVGRGIVAIVIIVVGMMFFTGKVSWNAMLATGLGVGTVFGAPSLVGLITGGTLICK